MMFVFERCSLLVISGAQVTLSKPQFRDMDSSADRHSVYVHGAGSRAVVHTAAASRAVSSGWTYRLEQTSQHPTSTIPEWRCGVEVKDEGLALTLSDCNIIVNAPSPDAFHLDVHVHESSSAQLSRLSISGLTIRSALACIHHNGSL